MPQSDVRDIPPSSRGDDGRDELDDFVRAFEEAYQHRGGADPAAFLPPRGHPLHRDVLRELVRVDLEFGWERGCPKTLDAYQRDFPELIADHDGLREIAFEEYRLRRQAGQAPSPDEYWSRYGVALEPRSGRLRSVARFPSRSGRDQTDRSSGGTFVARGDWRSTRAIVALPEVGDRFLGFRLVGDLGHGSFGRVYLAHQGDLADRTVVLKVTADRHDEARTLAQLQHDHIVPVYSRHRQGVLRAVCMPYLGSVTLRDVLDDLKVRGTVPGSGQELLSSLNKSSERKTASVRAASGSGSGSTMRRERGKTAPHPGEGHGTKGARPADEGGAPSTAPDPAGHVLEPAVPPRGTTDARTVLSGLSYVEAVVWMAARVAQGLVHAHERGILHRDLKPANILLTDDGRPMLLDFNLAADLKQPLADGDDAGVGGTLPYMAPEHIEAFRGGRRDIDARSDLYALGVILYEMLTGRPPFPVREAKRGDRESLRTMIADRQGPPPLLRPFNPAVSPAVESLVRHCLEPDPERRYTSARQLTEDLERQLAHRSLKHAPEPSVRERIVKWATRNAPLLAGLGVLAVLAALTAALAAYQHRLDRFEARAALTRFHTEGHDAHSRLAAWLADPAQSAEGLASARRALAGFHVLDDHPTPWWDRPPAVRLTAAERDEVRCEAGNLLILIALGEMSADPTPASRQATLRAALRTSERAERCFPPGRAPVSLWAQRAELLASLGDRDAAARAGERARNTRLSTPRDFVYAGIVKARAGRPVEALVHFEQALRLDPGDYWAWLCKGIGHAQMREDATAALCFDTCVALARDNSAAWYFRGALHLRHLELAEAEADLDTALRLRPDDIDVLIDRALCDLHRRRFAEAVRGFTRVIDRGTPYSRVYFMRANARVLAGDTEGARLDRAEGLRRVPTDGPSWIVRSAARDMDHDTTGALDDLEQALKLLPDNFDALWNKAGILSDTGRNAEAIGVLDRLATLFPNHAPVRGSRGVLHARLGHRDAALTDADLAMTLSRSPESTYYAACTRALTSRTHPDDRAEALRLLGMALENGFGLLYVDSDRDLDPVRNDPRFQRLVVEAKATARARSDGTPPRPVRTATTPAVAPASPQPGRSTMDRPGLPAKANAP
jgi:serine/threonine protein kinase/Flp pilus assembly protein TadD